MSKKHSSSFFRAYVISAPQDPAASHEPAGILSEFPRGGTIRVLTGNPGEVDDTKEPPGVEGSAAAAG
jgi:hypothetical protein